MLNWFLSMLNGKLFGSDIPRNDLPGNIPNNDLPGNIPNDDLPEYESEQIDKYEERIEYYKNIDIFWCNDLKCGISAYQGTGYHCISCFGELTKWKPLDSYNEVIPYRIIINCKGMNCRKYSSDEIYCESCSGPMK